MPYACATRQALPAIRRNRRYFPPIVTTKRARPRLRRRFSTFRPALVFMRERKPCLFTRLRFRGRYVGIMMNSPTHLYWSFRIRKESSLER
jgi:hypothetical protein